MHTRLSQIPLNEENTSSNRIMEGSIIMAWIWIKVGISMGMDTLLKRSKPIIKRNGKKPSPKSTDRAIRTILILKRRHTYQQEAPRFSDGSNQRFLVSFLEESRRFSSMEWWSTWWLRFLEVLCMYKWGKCEGVKEKGKKGVKNSKKKQKRKKKIVSFW